MEKLSKHGKMRVITGAISLVILAIVILFVLLSGGSGAWFTQKEDVSAVYDMGIVKLDGPDNIQYNIKELNFKASTMLRGTAEDDENFNSCVFVAHGQVQNLSTVPITLDFLMDNTFVSEKDSTKARTNPGLMYSVFYCRSDTTVETEKAALKTLKTDNDYRAYFNGLSGFTEVAAGGNSIPSYVNDALQKQPITIDPATDGKKATYEMYWIFWVDHEKALGTVEGLQSNNYQALTDQYGVNINMRARQTAVK